MGLSSHGRRRRRAVDGEQLLALGAAAVAKAGGEACAKAGRAKEDGVGRAAVVVLVAGAYEQPNAPAHPDLPHYSIRAERRRADQRAELAKACASSDATTRDFSSTRSAIFFPARASVLRAARRGIPSPSRAPETILHISRPD